MKASENRMILLALRNSSNRNIPSGGEKCSPGMVGGAPADPYAISGGMTNFRFSPTHILEERHTISIVMQQSLNLTNLCTIADVHLNHLLKSSLVCPGILAYNSIQTHSIRIMAEIVHLSEILLKELFHRTQTHPKRPWSHPRITWPLPNVKDNG